MSVLQESQIKAYCSFPVCLLPDGTDEIFLATADGGNHFLDFGIHEGMELIFDAQKGFTDGEPSCFVDKETHKIKLLLHAEEGYEHAGKLIAAITYYGG